jgi:glycosyltransferase involved in cell wall biosynthesis
MAYCSTHHPRRLGERRASAAGKFGRAEATLVSNYWNRNSATVNAAPRLSIGLPVYNGEKYLAESIEALLGQSFEDFELIISDNASTDSTADICRRYAKQDARIRYVRQPYNIGSTPNHNFLFQQSRADLFKWAAADDLYARDLLQRCVDTLDEFPGVILAHSWTAAIDSKGNVTQAFEYPLATDSQSAPERFEAMLFGSGGDYGIIRADDQYGVIRSEVLHRIGPHDSYYHADRTLMTKIALYGPFHQAPDWLYFRRDHSDRPQHACPTVRSWCANMDPRRADRLRHPTARLLAEYMWGYIDGIRRAPLSASDRQQCYRHLMRWTGSRAFPVSRRILRRGVLAGDRVEIAPLAASISVGAVVAGQQRGVF